MLEEQKSIRALDRGLSIVELLSNRGVQTLAQLRRATGLSNATLLRVLTTLQKRGWVRRNIAEGQFELAHSLGDVLGANARAHPLAEIAAPFLLDMETRKLGFPSDLCAVVGPAKMEVVESTRVRGPLAPGRTGMGIRPSMIRSAHGRAFLAFVAKDQHDIHLQALQNTENLENQRWLQDGRFQREIAEARMNGYGQRDDDYFLMHAFDEGPDLAAIAVPIQSDTGIHGTISILWLREDNTLERVLSIGAAEDMKKAAKRIGEEMDRRRVPAPYF